MNIETNNPAMKIFIILILFLSSCVGKSAKDYKYIETSMRTNLSTTTPKENRALEIRAKTDSEAYVQSYIHFCISKRAYNDEFQKSGAIAGKPLSFKCRFQQHAKDDVRYA